MSILHLLWELVSEFFLGTEEEQAKLRSHEDLLHPFNTERPKQSDCDTPPVFAPGVTTEEAIAALRAFPAFAVVRPMMRPQECLGCRHYQGSTYGGNPLVCGMHPYGTGGDDCGDWERSHLEEPIE